MVPWYEQRRQRRGVSWMLLLLLLPVLLFGGMSLLWRQVHRIDYEAARMDAGRQLALTRDATHSGATCAGTQHVQQLAAETRAAVTDGWFSPSPPPALLRSTPEVDTLLAATRFTGFWHRLPRDQQFRKRSAQCQTALKAARPSPPRWAYECCFCAGTEKSGCKCPAAVWCNSICATCECRAV